MAVRWCVCNGLMAFGEHSMEVQDEQCRCEEWGAGETSSAR